MSPDACDDQEISNKTTEIYSLVVGYAYFGDLWTRYIAATPPDRVSSSGFMEFIQPKLSEIYESEDAQKEAFRRGKIFAEVAQRGLLKEFFAARAKCLSMDNEIGRQIADLIDSACRTPFIYKQPEIWIKTLKDFNSGEVTPDILHTMQDFLRIYQLYNIEIQVVTGLFNNFDM